METPADRQRKAEQAMIKAEQRLLAGDLKGCKDSAISALSANPHTPFADALLAAAGALLAAERHGLPSDGPADPYEVLGLISAVPTAREPAKIESQYRRISGLLNRSHSNRLVTYAFVAAARHVDEAWAFLSDPIRKAALDSNLDVAAAAVAAAKTAVAAAARGEYLRICVSTEPAPARQAAPRRRRSEPEHPPAEDDGQTNGEEDTGAVASSGGRSAYNLRRTKRKTTTTTAT